MPRLITNNDHIHGIDSHRHRCRRSPNRRRRRSSCGMNAATISLKRTFSEFPSQGRQSFTLKHKLRFTFP